jgi:ubiquitin carboxyl-terminal hydrolase 9/13
MIRSANSSSYANSVIQALYFCSPFRDLLIQAVDNAIPPITAAPLSLFAALRSLFVHISTHPADKGTVAPKAFIDKLKEINEAFRGTQHQDAHEFLNYLLNKVIEEIEEDRKVIHNCTPPPEDCKSLTSFPSPVPP